MRPLGGPAAGAQRWMQRIQPVRSQPPTLSSPGQFLPGYCTHVWSRPFSLVATPYSNGRLLFYQANTRAYTFPAVEGWEGRMPTVLEIAGCSYLRGSLIVGLPNCVSKSRGPIIHAPQLTTPPSPNWGDRLELSCIYIFPRLSWFRIPDISPDTPHGTRVLSVPR